MGKFAIATIIASGFLITGIVWVTNRAANTGPVQGELIQDLGGQHIAAGQEHIPYNSNPPSSGPHYTDPQPAGIFEQDLIDERVIHSLEHGGVWLSYKPDLPKDQVDQLKAIVRKNRAKVILAPRSKSDSAIALVSWNRVLKIETPEEEIIKQFIRANRDHAPETLPL